MGPKLEGCAFANFGNSSGAWRNRTYQFARKSYSVPASLEPRLLHSQLFICSPRILKILCIIARQS